MKGNEMLSKAMASKARPAARGNDFAKVYSKLQKPKKAMPLHKKIATGKKVKSPKC